MMLRQKNNKHSNSAKYLLEFDEDGLAVATKENVDRMSERDLMEFCPKWNLDKINPLIVQMAEISIFEENPY